MDIALGQQARDGDALNQRNEQQHGKIGLPAEEHRQEAAERRSEQWRNGHRAAHVGNDPRRLGGAPDVANDRPGEHRAGAGADRLHEARADQQLDAWGKDAADGRQTVDRQPAEHQRPAAEAIGERTVEQLSAGKAGEKD